MPEFPDNQYLSSGSGGSLRGRRAPAAARPEERKNPFADLPVPQQLGSFNPIFGGGQAEGEDSGDDNSCGTVLSDIPDEEEIKFANKKGLKNSKYN